MFPISVTFCLFVFLEIKGLFLSKNKENSLPVKCEISVVDKSKHKKPKEEQVREGERDGSSEVREVGFD